MHISNSGLFGYIRSIDPSRRGERVKRGGNGQGLSGDISAPPPTTTLCHWCCALKRTHRHSGCHKHGGPASCLVGYTQASWSPFPPFSSLFSITNHFSIQKLLFRYSGPSKKIFFSWHCPFLITANISNSKLLRNFKCNVVCSVFSLLASFHSNIYLRHERWWRKSRKFTFPFLKSIQYLFPKSLISHNIWNTVFERAVRVTATWPEKD